MASYNSGPIDPKVPRKLSDLDDAKALAAATNGQTLAYSTAQGAWLPAAPGGGGGASTLDGLADVTVVAPAQGNGLYYNIAFGQWANGAVTFDGNGVSGWDAGGVPPLGQTRNLIYETIAAAPGYRVGPSATATTTVTALNDLSDVTTGGVLHGHSLIFNTATSQFENGTIPLTSDHITSWSAAISGSDTNEPLTRPVSTTSVHISEMNFSSRIRSFSASTM